MGKNDLEHGQVKTLKGGQASVVACAVEMEEEVVSGNATSNDVGSGGSDEPME